MRRSFRNGLALCALMACGVVGELNAQGGFLGRARRAATETVAGAVVDGAMGDRAAGAAEDRSGESEAPGSSVASTEISPAESRSSHLLAMDGGVLDRFERALTAEIEFRDEWVALEQRFVPGGPPLRADAARDGGNHGSSRMPVGGITG